MVGMLLTIIVQIVQHSRWGCMAHLGVLNVIQGMCTGKRL